MTERLKKRVLLPASCLLFLLFFTFAEEITGAVRGGLLLCAHSLVPALFPFIILSRVLLTGLAGGSLPGGALFERLFHLPRAGAAALFVGALCGYPLGAGCVADLYRAGSLDCEEAERLLSFSNNAGPAFAVAGIGLAVFKNPALGWVLYVSQLAAALLYGILSARGEPCPVSAGRRGERAVSGIPLSGLFREASLTMLTICGTVVFFSALCGIPSRLLPPLPFAVLCSFLEIGNAATAAAALPFSLALPLCAFSLSFSGLSVHLQTAAILREIPYSGRRYLAAKLTQGALAALLAALALPLLGG